MAGDWLQFVYPDSDSGGAFKVYQVAQSVIASDIGIADVVLNTGLVKPILNNVQVRSGPDVRFRLLATQLPPTFTIPGSNGSLLYNFTDQVIFREVL